MWNKNQNSYNNTSSFKKHLITFNLHNQAPLLQNVEGQRLPTNVKNAVFTQQNLHQKQNKQCMKTLPHQKNNCPNTTQSDFSSSFEHQTVSGFTSPLLTTRSASPIFSSNILESKQKCSAIPFIGDADESANVQDGNINKPFYKDILPGLGGGHHTSASICESVSGKNAVVHSSLYDGIPEVSNKSDNTFSKLKSEENVGNPIHTDVPNPALNPTLPVYVAAAAEMEPDEAAVTKGFSEDGVNSIPFNISQVLGDAKMLNDILSVAKTIQFSEQSKSLNFPTSTSKSVAIVPPINVQSEVHGSLVSSSPSSNMPDSEKYVKPVISQTVTPLTLPPFLGALMDSNQVNCISNRETSNTLHQANCGNETQPIAQQNSKACSGEVTYDDRVGRPKHTNHPVPGVNCSSVSSPTSFEIKQSTLFEGSIVNENNSSRRLCDSSLKRLSTDSVSSQCSSSLSKTKKLDHSSTTNYQEDTIQTEVFPKCSNSDEASLSTSAESLSVRSIKSSLFSELEKCSISNDSDANTILEVISALTEIYLKYKLRFIPKTKFQSLIKSVREGKEKETNFVLSFLKCDSARDKVSTLKEIPNTDNIRESSITSPDASNNEEPEKEASKEESKTDNFKRDKTVVLEELKTADVCVTSAGSECSESSTVTTVTNVLNVSVSSNIPQLQPFIPMYTSGGVNMPVNYWMTHGMPVMHPSVVAVPQQMNLPRQSEPTLKFQSMQPPLPPPQIATVQPPLPPPSVSHVQPPLPPPQRFVPPLVPPPIPLSQVPLPPPPPLPPP